ncbi:Uncharacterised protein [Mycobacteroides abscessus subsp. abscessus]|nr:Uncharacterised protein [Mycobacteroides abscessus subsp. abscessus]
MDEWVIGVPRGRVIDWTRATPRACRTDLATRSSSTMPAGLRISKSVSIIRSSGLRRATEKWRSAAA